MSKPLTHVAIVLDYSGSMASTKESTVTGFNEQVQQLKENAKDQDIRASLITFNGHVREHFWEEPVDRLVEATAEDYQPVGSTALRDAVGYTIQKLIDTTDYEDPNAAYLLIVISDGQNTDHGPYTPERLRELIESVQATGRWTITYLGCSESYLHELSRQTGVSASNMAVWSNATHEKTAKGLKMSADKYGDFFKMRATGATASANVHSSVRDCVANYDEDNAGETVKRSFQTLSAVPPGGYGNSPLPSLPPTAVRASGACSMSVNTPEPIPAAVKPRPLSELHQQYGNTYEVTAEKQGKTVFGTVKSVKLK